MQEEYSTPKSNLVDDQVLSKTQYFLLILMVCISAGFYHVSCVFPSPFVETFEAFGAELPLLTILAIQGVPVFKILSYVSFTPVIGLIGIVIEFKYQMLVYKIAKINTALSFIVLLAVIMAMYLPIFTIGSAI